MHHRHARSHQDSGGAARPSALSRGPRPRALALAAILGLLVVLLGGSPAAAHAELESSSPKDGATLETPPSQITFTFGEELLDTGNAITLTPAGSETRLTLDEPTVDGDTITVPWPATAPAGEFTAAYRVVSADGHPVEGTITFTVETATGSAPSAPSSAQPSAVAVDSAPTGLPSAVASAAPSPSSTPGGAAPESQPEAGVLAWVLGVGVLALVGALAATWVTRRTKS